MSQVPFDLNSKCGGKEQLASGSDKQSPTPETGQKDAQPEKGKPVKGLMQPGPKPQGDTADIKDHWSHIWKKFHEWWSQNPTISWPDQRNKVEELVNKRLIAEELKSFDREHLFIDVLTNEEIVNLIVEGVNRLPMDMLTDLVSLLRVTLARRKGAQTHDKI